jgi:hypothetical protein
MGLKDILQQHNIPLPSDFDERLSLIVKGLRKNSNFKSDMESFKKQSGGFSLPFGKKPEGPVDPATIPPPLVVSKQDVGEDWLGPRLRWFVNAMTSPYARTLLGGLFMVIFFLSYLEKIPVFGRIISASLDVILAGGKMLVKSVQSILPAAIGTIPLPYTAMVGIGLAAVLGMIIWPIFAIISLSRQDFAAAIESYIRIIPPPFGDMLANTFLEGNRAIAKLDEKRQQLANDISTALTQLSTGVSNISQQMRDGFISLAKQVSSAVNTAKKSVPKMPTAPTMPTMPTMPTAPTMPTMPTAPAMPIAPTMPTAPTMPKLPTMPSMPKMPVKTAGFHRRSKRKAWRPRTTRRKSGRR